MKSLIFFACLLVLANYYARVLAHWHWRKFGKIPMRRR